jgi:hypothetical protein
MPEMNDAVVKATAEANETFAKLGKAVEDAVKRGTKELDVATIARAAGLEIDAKALDELQIDRVILPHPWIPWYIWFPWRPLWCWWWRFRYPWYRCCPWWWHRCHWHPYW